MSRQVLIPVSPTRQSSNIQRICSAPHERSNHDICNSWLEIASGSIPLSHTTITAGQSLYLASLHEPRA
jgi:hypothetical protein